MILIADSGSTKTQWAAVKNGKIEYEIFSSGINPFYQSQSDIQELVETQLISELNTTEIEAIYFYGAGCAFEEKNALVRNALRSYFSDATIEIHSDLLGAARALFQHSQGIACILGTGSNSCYYNGHDIANNVSPLGFILGDEGSGAVLSKKFIANCLKNQVSEELTQKFLSTYHLTPALVLDNVYKKPFPNRYLAQFTPFLAENLQHPDVCNLVLESFGDFFERNVQQYDYKNHKTSFIGSVAYYFKTTLETAATNCNIQMGEVYKSPIQGLVKFHSDRYKEIIK